MKVEAINAIKALEHGRYAAIEEKQNLLTYTIQFLMKKGIESTFPYLCVGSFRLFPEEFCLDEEFKNELDSLKVRKYADRLLEEDLIKEKDGAFKLTQKGKDVAKDTSAAFYSGDTKMDLDKDDTRIGSDDVSKNYTELQLSKQYSSYLVNKRADLKDLWSFFGVTPHTKSDKIQAYLEEINDYAKSIGDKPMIAFTETMLEDL